MIRKGDVIIIMGVSGSGKSTIGKALAQKAGYGFEDADAHHPAANIDKMKAGIPLTDADRTPWLRRLAALVDTRAAELDGLVLACSALRHDYRLILSSGRVKPRFVFLDGPMDLILARMTARAGHFMPAALLESQFETLEVPETALRAEIDRPVDTIVADLAQQLWPQGL